ncbi:hypothetical protein K491DRAFT_586706 [Lophiostoma macrostomum CBS 122681]|uniref:Cora-domain-containing protein n=1 Tax=Lophiostoma macrostomum CBS 122681 TaxID=1314788 RepID=A0A6A6TSG2_9PLEO|nr:hypothetical protein K491DRAFT_586706 [Lophiostoma macrostomum CBS 122681]
MSGPTPKRSKSDPPPPIMVEDTATGAPPQPSPSPTHMTARSFSAFEPQLSPQQQASGLRQRRNTTWGHRRKHSPGVEWHEKWTQNSWKDGRVLLVDYVAKEHTSSAHRRKIVAQEFSNIDALRKFYLNQDLSQQAALRVIHVQNAPWAMQFLLRKFNIDASDDIVGTAFGRWVKYEKPRQRGAGPNARPVPSGKTFRKQTDPWRGISRAAFGMDYLRTYNRGIIPESPGDGMKMMELNHFDNSEYPEYGYDVYVQRMSVYVQLSDGDPTLPVDPDMPSPYNEDEGQEYHRLKQQYNKGMNGHEKPYIPRLRTLDNGSTIIIFEQSQSKSPHDTLIGAREEIENRWRRLTFMLPPLESSDDDQQTTECMDLILRHIFQAVSFSWERFLSLSETHVSILEDKIYENPADESRAPELWTNSSNWLKIERLMYTHLDVIKEMRTHMHDLYNEDPRDGEPWLQSSPEEMEKQITQFNEGVIKPTTSLSDLMYKSVGIRDARHSLQLGLSMWRLSWITFIFLPLTFVSGFFGMNVDAFSHAESVSIKWWFVTTVPLFAVVLCLWYGVKHTLASQRQDPLRRGVYETLFLDLSKQYPGSWTRRGPRDDVAAEGRWSALRWGLLKRWFGYEKTIKGRGYDAGDEELGVWSRVKRYLLKRWLRKIQVGELVQDVGLQHLPTGDVEAEADAPFNTLPSPSGSPHQDLGAVGELLHLATPVAIADADPTAASRLGGKLPLERLRSLSPTRSEGGRPGSGRSSKGKMSGDGWSGVMVEEKSEDERSGDEDADADADAEGRRRQRGFAERLNVPLYSGGVGGGGRGL